MKDTIRLTLTDKLAPFLFEKKRFKIIFGGRGGTKSQTIADILLHKVAQDGIKVGCFREHQATIEHSIHSLLTKEISRLDIPGFRINKTSIDHVNGGGFRFRGLARHASGVKSFHGFHIFFIEEAQFISENSLKMITPTLREEDSEFWAALNPMSRRDPIARRFIIPFIKTLRKEGVYGDNLHYVAWSNSDENPWMPKTLKDEMDFDYEHLPRAEFDHIWLGHFNDTIEGAIIKAEWFDACVDAHKKLGFEARGSVVVSHDPSDTGYDDKGLVLRHGSVILDAKLNKTGDVNRGLDWALEYAIQQQADLFVWDADGMGLGLKRQVSDGLHKEKIDWLPFRGSEGVDDPLKAFDEGGLKRVKDKKKQRTNKQALKNKRAQKYWELRNRIYNTYLAITRPEYRNQDTDRLISFSSDIEEIEQLRAELSKIPRKPNSNGLIQIMSKEDMKGKDIDSPNLADPTMMSLFTPDIKTENNITFSNPWRG